MSTGGKSVEQGSKVDKIAAVEAIVKQAKLENINTGHLTAHGRTGIVRVRYRLDSLSEGTQEFSPKHLTHQLEHDIITDMT